MTELLGLTVDRALEALRALGVSNVELVETRAPGKAVSDEGRTPRVVRVDDGGRRLVVALFPDDVEA